MTRSALTLVVLALLAPLALGQDVAPAAAQEPEQTDAQKFEAAIKDLKRVDGAWPLYQRKNEVLLDLAESTIGSVFYFQATLYKGFGGGDGGQAGDPVNVYSVDAYRLERHDDQVWLVQPNLRHRFDAGDPLAEASRRTFPEAILLGFKVEQKNPDTKHLLVNVTDLFLGQSLRIGEAVNALLAGAYELDREKSGPIRLKGYEDQSSVRSLLHFVSPAGAERGTTHVQDPRSVPMEVTFQVWYPKSQGYRPRVSDSRIGYFTEDFFNVSRFAERDRTERRITRFDLRKKDPGAALSEPIKPIVWVLDPSIPERFREGVRKGILMWNPAFEKIGFKNALVVQDAPSDPEWDHADGRHNLVRWTMSTSSTYAVALFRTDPFSGEILNAAVTVDANYPAAAFQDLRSTINPTNPSRDDLLKVVSGAMSLERLEDVHGDSARAATLQRLGWRTQTCTHAKGFAERAGSAFLLAKALGDTFDEQTFVTDFVADLVAHEIGHCLGLRHNFAASTQLSTNELRDGRRVGEVGLAASVMDYSPYNLSAILRGSDAWVNTLVGPYDQWAIEYGYSEFPDALPSRERLLLGLIAKRSGEPGHLYLTDEDVDGVNPLAATYDLGSDPLVWISDALAAELKIRNYVVNDLTRSGEDYGLRTQLLLRSLRADARYLNYATRFVGGIEYRRQRKGDVNELPTLRPVNASDQRLAVSLVMRHALSRESLGLSGSILNGLSQGGDRGDGGTWIAPLRSYIAGQRSGLLAALLSAPRLNAIVENEVKAGSGAYQLVEHFEAVCSGLFRELASEGQISAPRRDLQRFALDALIVLASGPSAQVSDDVRIVATDQLKRLRLSLGSAAAAAPDGSLQRLHLNDMREQVNRFFARLSSSGR